MNYLYSFLLGVVQGVGEFLPVAGSALLRLAREWGLPQDLIQNANLDGVLRWGTFLAVLLVCRKTVLGLLQGIGSMVKGLFDGSFKWRKAGKYQLMAVWLLVATLPMVVLAFIQNYYDVLGRWSDNLLFIGVMLLVSAGLVFIGSHSICHHWTFREMKVGHALKLGLFQAVACLPGLSRTATTLSMARNMGFEKETATDFALMMTLPTLLGANLLRIGSWSVPAAGEWGLLAVGFAAALAVGVLALLLFKWLMKKEWFGYTAYYCILAGLGALVLHFV